MQNFELPEGSQVASVKLRTVDIKKALGFYQEVLGFSVVGEQGPEVFLSAHGSGPTDRSQREPHQGRAIIVLSEDRGAETKVGGTTGLFHFAIRYPTRPSLAQAVRRLAQRNYPIEGASDHIVSEAIYLSDPEHNGIELYTDRPRAKWSWRDGQVTMATEALDLASLLATVDSGAETAQPPVGTDIGHIHLQVADLGVAERFYHEFLGLAVTQRSYPGALFMSAGGYHHHVAANTWGGPTPALPGSAGLVSYRLSVPAKTVLNGLQERAVRAGYEHHRVSSELDGEILQVRDPNGCWLEIA